MENVTLEITAELRDEASGGLKSILGISDRLNVSLSEMRRQLRAGAGEADELAAALTGLSAAGDTYGSSGNVGGTASGGKNSAGGAEAIAGSDFSGANAALGELAQNIRVAGSAANDFSGGIQGADAAITMADAAVQGLYGAGNAACGAASALVGALGQAGVSAQMAAAGMTHAGNSAQGAAGGLSALDSAAGVLRSRFAGFSLPNFAAHARGGILSTPHMGLVAEEGPEAIIPLSAQKRSRGIELLRQAGRRLGVRAYSEGGVPDGVWGSIGAGGIDVGGVNVNIEIKSDAEPARAIEQNGSKIADDVARAIADGLERALCNMAI